MDDRQYSGFWALGKQHGLGKYVVNEKLEDGTVKKKIKYGLWEDGKRIEWFTDDMVESIRSRREDYRSLFHKNTSSELVDARADFESPTNFESNMKKVLGKLTQLYNKNNAMAVNPLPPAPRAPRRN